LSLGECHSAPGLGDAPSLESVWRNKSEVNGTLGQVVCEFQLKLKIHGDARNPCGFAALRRRYDQRLKTCLLSSLSALVIYVTAGNAKFEYFIHARNGVLILNQRDWGEEVVAGQVRLESLAASAPPRKLKERNYI
jgi:hypothetical protein